MGQMQKDLREFVELLLSKKVEFVVVGAHALAFHGRPRLTEDIDFFVRMSPENAARIMETMQEFGIVPSTVTKNDFLKPDSVVQLGYAPNRIDLITSLSGVSPDEVWDTRVQGELDGLSVYFISLDTFAKNKRATGRKKDLGDLEGLGLL